MRLCVWCGAQVCWPLAKVGSRPPGITPKSSSFGVCDPLPRSMTGPTDSPAITTANGCALSNAAPNLPGADATRRTS